MNVAKLFLIIIDYFYLYSVGFLDFTALPLYYLGFLYLVKANSLIFNYGKSTDLSLNLKALVPWSFLYFLVSWPLVLLDGVYLWGWFNIWTLFMYSIGYAGYLILFQEFSLIRTVKFLWCRFGVDYTLKELFFLLSIANVFFYIKSYFYSLVPNYILVAVLLFVMFIVSGTIEKKYFKS